MKLHKNSSSGSQAVQCEWTDMTKVTITFRNFANMLKN
jgi:hypothetical protein